MPYLLGIDVGTSGTKAALFKDDGSTAASHTIGYPLHHPQNGWAEQTPEDWWAAVVGTIRAVLDMSGVSPSDIAGVGLTGQMHGLTLLDERDEVIRPAIIWCDQRTGSECAEITSRMGEKTLMDITANPALTGFTASKILWVRNHEPEAYQRARRILLPKDYIRFMLTGAAATDVADASGMQLLDVGRRQWSPEMLSGLGIDPELLPQVFESPEVTGQVSEKAAAMTGLVAGTPVVAGAGDNAAAAVGTGVVREGTSFTTIGTSGVVFVHSNEMKVDLQGRVHTFCCAVPGAWHMMGVTQAAGLSLQWFKNQFCQAETEAARAMGTSPYTLLDAEAARSPVGAHRLLYLPYLMGERTPHLDPDCRGAFLGLSALHERRDLLRAVMEGVSFSLRDCVEIFSEMGIAISHTRVCGGGAGSALWRQMLADVFGLPIVTTRNQEGPALGAALLAGVGTGVYADVLTACDRIVFADPAHESLEESRTAYEAIYRVYRAAYPALKDLYKELSAL